MQLQMMQFMVYDHCFQKMAVDGEEVLKRGIKKLRFAVIMIQWIAVYVVYPIFHRISFIAMSC